jgi:hypothetical protein
MEFCKRFRSTSHAERLRSYRFTDTWSTSGEWRYGSGQPIPGFYRQVGSEYFLTDQRNRVRVPDYSRVDVRLSKAFLLRRWKLTVTGEVINLLNCDNVRYSGFDGFGSNGQVLVISIECCLYYRQPA